MGRTPFFSLEIKNYMKYMRVNTFFSFKSIFLEFPEIYSRVGEECFQVSLIGFS